MKREAAVKFIGRVEKNTGGTARISIFPKYKDALKGIGSFSHLIILYWLHLRDTEKDRRTLRVVPKRHRGAPEMGVFGTRSPSRPNPIGLSVVRLEKLESNLLTVRDLDALEDTPIIDIKPYLPRADRRFKVKVPVWTEHGPAT
ncbi:MAG: tRNA (N6-threonylcarbamoyladenosine(37)-N6)-methyltransferase TrmO [Candidatus Bathyarchaeia archaeon]